MPTTRSFSLLLSFVVALLHPTCALKQSEDFYERKFFDFLKKFKINIRDGDDYYYRLNIFSKRFDEIEDFNAKHEHVKWGINKFSHLTSEEFSDYVNRGGTIIAFPVVDDDFKASEGNFFILRLSD